MILFSYSLLCLIFSCFWSVECVCVSQLCRFQWESVEQLRWSWCTCCWFIPTPFISSALIPLQVVLTELLILSSLPASSCTVLISSSLFLLSGSVTHAAFLYLWCEEKSITAENTSSFLLFHIACIYQITEQLSLLLWFYLIKHLLLLLLL